MENLAQNCVTSKDYLTAYFKSNAFSRFGVEIKKYIWFKQARFLNPMKKEYYLRRFVEEEISKFINKGEVNIPFLEFSLVTGCNFECKSCEIPLQAFSQNRIQITAEQFKTQFDKICNSVSSIRHLVLTLPEPLENPEFVEILEYAAQKEKVHMIQIHTRGDFIPTEQAFNILEKYSQKAYFLIENNKTEQTPFKKVLQSHNIKFQTACNK